MTPEERSELASLHALSLLEGEDALLAARLVETDPAFAAEVDEFADAMAILAVCCPPMEPSEFTKERILAIAKKPVSKPSLSWVGWAAAAAAVIGFTFLWMDRSQLAGDSQKLALSEKEAKSARDQLAKELEKLALLEKETRSDRDQLAKKFSDLQQQSSFANLRIASLESKVQEFETTRAIVVWDESRHNGLIRLTGLPVAGEGKDYQLWVVDPAKTAAVNAGLIHRDESGTATVSFKPDQEIGEAKAFAISVEKTGGVPVAEGPIVLVGQ